jgi:norsolorinic acid ketoreductase
VGELQALPVGTDSRLIIVKLDSDSPTGATDAVEELQLKFGVSQLDTVIANAGIGKYWGPATQTPIHEVEEHFKINAVAPVRLFQAVQPLLFATSNPRFVVISTVLGSIALQKDFPVPDAAYGMSKIAVNFFVGKLHHENTQLTTFPIHPGYVECEGVPWSHANRMW